VCFPTGSCKKVSKCYCSFPPSPGLPWREAVLILMPALRGVAQIRWTCLNWRKERVMDPTCQSARDALE
jgi:hypothetical protein